jgi:hypothetical protein
MDSKSSLQFRVHTFAYYLFLFVESTYMRGINAETFLFKYRAQTGLNKIHVTSYKN